MYEYNENIMKRDTIYKCKISSWKHVTYSTCDFIYLKDI